jgi:DNA-binding NarL/FixJ family response regulator
MSKIRIMIADDQSIIRDGLKSLLESNPNFEVIHLAENGDVACRYANLLNPDVILMDIRMPVLNGVDATKCIKKENPNIKIIILTTFDDDAYIIEAMRHGASGYLLKDTSSQKLFDAISDAVLGHIILPGEIALKIISHLPQSSIKKMDLTDFSKRELDIIHLLVLGKSNTEIADTLFLSIGTVKNYLSQIYSKIDCIDRSNAILYFKNLGL